MPNPQEVQLTAREKQVVKMICKNMKYREIADHLGLGYETVKTYANRIRTKLGLTSKVAVVLWAQQKGLI
jgi:DNA-binding CsgD family transcriptional regulator